MSPSRVVSIVAVAALLAAAPAAHAGELVDGAAGALRSDPVYVHSDAEPTLTDAEADAVAAALAAALA
jgi:hypothetical protein